MARYVFIFLLACLPLKALADCGNLSRQLLNVTVGGTRDYLTSLPQGLQVTSQHGSDDGGSDQIQGKSSGLTIRGAMVYRHEHRVYLVQTIISGADEEDIERILKKVLAIAGTDFDPNPKLVPSGQYLRCTDGLSARVVRTQQVLTRTIPLLVVHLEHPRLSLRARCAMRPQQCVNLPKHLYE